MLTELEKQVTNAGGGRAGAIAVISDILSGDLMSDLDPMEWDDYQESVYSKQRIAGSFETYQEYKESDAFECGANTELEEEEWQEHREDFLDRASAKRAEKTLDALVQLAAKYDIPFDKDLARSTATAFAENHPVWDMSVC